MKTYLLLVTIGSYEVDDENLVTNLYQVGNYDTVEEALEAAKKDLVGEAEEVAGGRFDREEEPEEYKEFLHAYLENTTLNEVDEDSFTRPGADRIVVEQEYYSDCRQDKRTYTIIKLM